MESASISSTNSRRVVARFAASKRQRSRITNGHLLPDLDGRSALARRFKDIMAALVSDQGGADRLTEARFQLMRRFAAAAVIAEVMESRLARGAQINISEHAQLSSTLVRISARIGINRRFKDITPALPDYLDAVEAEADETVSP
jgi:hypothetical protein